MTDRCRTMNSTTKSHRSGAFREYFIKDLSR